MHYDKEINATIITFIRAAYEPLYVKGDIVKDIKQFIMSHGSNITTVGV